MSLVALKNRCLKTGSYGNHTDYSGVLQNSEMQGRLWRNLAFQELQGIGGNKLSITEICAFGIFQNSTEFKDIRNFYLLETFVYYIIIYKNIHTM